MVPVIEASALVPASARSKPLIGDISVRIVETDSVSAPPYPLAEILVDVLSGIDDLDQVAEVRSVVEAVTDLSSSGYDLTISPDENGKVFRNGKQVHTPVKLHIPYGSTVTVRLNNSY